MQEPPGHTRNTGQSQTGQPQGLNPNDFRVAATDSKGHSERAQFRGQPGLIAQVGRVIDGRMFPYRNQADLIRHALMKHLAWLETLAPIPSILAQLRTIDMLFAEAEFQQDFTAMYADLQKYVGTYQAQGQPEEARALVLRIQDQLRGMPPGAWRDKYLAEIKQRFGYVMDGQGVGLGQMVED